MAIPDNPKTRGEQYLNAIATGDTSVLPAEPITREEQYLDYIARNGGGGGGGGSGLTDDIKDALIACFDHVVWDNTSGQAYIDALFAALSGLKSISAVFNPGANVIYDTDSLDSLKQYLVVTATLQDGSTSVVSAEGYTLSGALTVGTSTVTVSYIGKTTTFNVTVADFLTSLSFEAYPWASVGSGQYAQNIWKNQTTSARARCTVPFTNAGYTFSIVDTDKYNMAVYGVTSLEIVPVTSGGQTKDTYPGEENSAVSWATSGSRTTPYVAISFKKLDNTNFTAEELANMYGTVFTATRS